MADVIKVVKYHTPHGDKTLQELRELLASKHITTGQLGDDALKALGIAASTPAVPTKLLVPATTLPPKNVAGANPVGKTNVSTPVPVIPKAPLTLPKSSVAPVKPQTAPTTAAQVTTKPANPFVKKS